MAARRPLVIISPQVQQLPTGDIIVQEQTATSFTINDGQFAITTRLTMAGANGATIAGTGCLIVVG